MRIQNMEINVDVQKYLEKLKLKNVTHTGTDIMASCPFHDDTRPSFGVNIETGLYNCFGCGASGTFAQLVQRLEHFDTVYDAEQYLINMYGKYIIFNPGEPLDLEFEEQPTQPYSIPRSILDEYRLRHPYLTRRGIHELTQQAFEVGYSDKHNAITIPWFDHQGNLLTVFMRSVNSKKFRYFPKMPKRIKVGSLWGLDKILKHDYKKVAIAEGPIDGISIWQEGRSLGVGAVAIGGNKLSVEQASLLKRVLDPETEIITFTDNDVGGVIAKTSIIDQLAGQFKISEINWNGISHKDANSALPLIKQLLQNRKLLGLNLDFGEGDCSI